MKANTHATPAAKGADKVVLAFLTALNDEDFDGARQLLEDQMAFEGVMGKRDSADEYIKDMRNMKFKYHVKKTFVDGDDVCLLYDIDMGKGKTIFTCGWYRLKNGKIATLKVVFDPRPLLEGSDRKN